MNPLNILIVEGNIDEDTEIFVEAAGSSAAENFKKLILKFQPSANVEIIHPGNENETIYAIKKINQYNGIVFTGGAMRINDMTGEIKKHINFAKKCFSYKKKILAICWGLQVCVVAAGGKVAPGKNGAHIGIAFDVEINEEGQKNSIYKDKKKIFTTPAFNFDEVSEIPVNSTVLSSDKINRVMGIYFKSDESEIWGLQYHPDYKFYQTINLSHLRKEKLIEREYFKNEADYKKHISFIDQENNKLDFNNRSREVKNWLELI